MNVRIAFNLLLIIATNLVYAQGSNDYVILKPSQSSTKPDTVFGQIELPENGIILSAKINTDLGKQKYKAKDVIGFKAGNLYFASLPYTNGFVFAPRLIEGPIDLYFYNTGVGGYTIVCSNGNFQSGISAVAIGSAMNAVLVNMTSYFYLHDFKTNSFYIVPHSSKKFIAQIGDIFKDNSALYNKIINGDFNHNQIPEIVEKYNKSIE